jgi:hypothetical protein
MPVAVLFSSPSLSQPECGTNFIVPDHRGAPMRLLDCARLTTQSPELGPYGDQPYHFLMNNGSQWSDTPQVYNVAANRVDWDDYAGFVNQQSNMLDP